MPTLDELIQTARAAAESDEPIAQLTAAAALKSELDELTDQLLGHFVDQARRAGCSWSQIGAALGVSKQAAQQRHTSQPTFERFTERAKTSLREAEACSRRLGQPYVGTEHLLAGLAAVPEGIAGKIVVAAGLDVAGVERAITDRIAAGEPLAVDAKVPYTPKAGMALSRTLSIALGMGHNYIGTEHLLLALAQGQETVARAILDDAGLAAGTIDEQVAAALAPFLK